MHCAVFVFIEPKPSQIDWWWLFSVVHKYRIELCFLSLICNMWMNGSGVRNYTFALRSVVGQQLRQFVATVRNILSRWPKVVSETTFWQFRFLPLHAFYSFLYEPLFRRAERSLFAQRHVRMISFFPVRDINLRFNSLNLIFLSHNGRIYPIFVQTLRRVHNLSRSKVSAAEIFFRWVISKKNSIFRFFRGQRVFFWVLSLQ